MRRTLSLSSLSRRYVPRGLLIAAAVSALVSSAIIQAVALRAHADVPATTVLGSWAPSVRPPGVAQDGFGQKNQLYADSGSRRLYAYDSFDNWIAAYNLDSLAPIGSGASTSGTGTAFYADPVTGAIFGGFQEVSGQIRLDEFAVRGGAIQRVGTLDLTTPQLAGTSIVGMYRMPGSPLMWLLAAPSVGNTFVPASPTVVQVWVDGFESGRGQLAWSKALPGCSKAMRKDAQIGAGLGYVPETNALVFGCANVSDGTFVRPSSPRGAGQLTLVGSPRDGSTTAGAFDLFPQSGDFYYADSVFDPGSNRLVLTAYSSVTGGGTAYVFDGPTSTFIGGTSIGNNLFNQVGIDPVIGRLYVLNPNESTGLVLADIRPNPPSQGASVPALNNHVKHDPAPSNLVVDSYTHNIFLKYNGLDDFLLVRDNLAPYVPEPSIDPDENTSDLAEEEGKTRVAFGTGAEAFGSVVRQVGGFDAIVINSTGQDQGGTKPISMGTREFRGAYLNYLHLRNDEASASIIPADVDRANSKQDLTKTKPPDQSALPPDVPRPPPPPDPPDEVKRQLELANPVFDRITGQQVTWPYADSQCADFGEKPGEAQQAGSFASCHASEHRVSANASFGRYDAPDVVIADSFAESSSAIDPKLGAVATVHARSRGVSFLGGAVRIGEVDVVAKSWARGRPGTANTAYTRTIKNVFLNNAQLCADTCDPKAVVDQINTALRPQGVSTNASLRIDLPEPDSTYRNGSPKGYQALIRSTAFQHTRDVLLNEQPEDRLDVPGMVVVIAQDNLKPGRTIVMLAGAEVEAHYGISSVGGGLDDGGPGGTGGGLGGLLAGEDGPLFGLPPGLAPDGPLGGSRSPSLAGSSDDGGSPAARAGRLLLNGLKRAAALFPVWAILLAPIYLSARRWLLLQRSVLLRRSA
ncbi:MAG: hypothetical protein QOK43_887 [Acidimicrobiaceae bacterium]|nr:hypothetical protein [Acidimicrobiaceae bacterium]